jgi:hypothetical protein
MTDFSSYIPPEARAPGWTKMLKMPPNRLCIRCLGMIHGTGWYHAAANQWLCDPCMTWQDDFLAERESDATRTETARPGTIGGGSESEPVPGKIEPQEPSS